MISSPRSSLLTGISGIARPRQPAQQAVLCTNHSRYRPTNIRIPKFSASVNPFHSRSTSRESVSRLDMHTTQERTQTIIISIIKVVLYIIGNNVSLRIRHVTWQQEMKTNKTVISRPSGKLRLNITIRNNLWIIIKYNVFVFKNVQASWNDAATRVIILNVLSVFDGK